MSNGSVASFDSLSLRVTPNFKVSESNRKRLRKYMQRLDVWGFEEGMTFDHVHVEASHVAFRTADRAYIGLYDNARFSIISEHVRIDSQQVRKIEKMATEIIARFGKLTGMHGTFEATILFHVLVTNASLKRFIRASSASATSSFLRKKLGTGIEVRGLIVRLEPKMYMSLSLPNDIDYSQNVQKIHKGFLYSVFSQAVNIQRKLARD